PEMDPLALEVRVAASVQLLVRVGESQPDAATFAVLDAAGEYLRLTVPNDGGSLISTGIPLTRSVSPVTRVSDEGVTLVLADKKGKELARVPIVLHAGSVNTVEVP